MSRRTLAGVAAVVVAAGVATAIVSMADAQAPGALEDQTPGGAVKIEYTGGSTPSPNDSIIGRLALPVGSWAIFAKSEIYTSGPQTGVTCFLVAPNTAGDLDDTEIGGGTKDDAVSTVWLETVSNAPDGGYADIACKTTNPAAGGTVLERGTVITALEVPGASATMTVPPPLGTMP